MIKLLIHIYLYLITTSVLYSHDYNKNNIEIFHPIIKVVKEDAKVGAGYMKITNNSGKEIELIGLKAEIAQTQEIHEVILKKDVYKMRPIKKNLVIEPGKVLEFKPKSYHFMFFDINKNLKEDEMLNAKLVFKGNFVIPIKFKIIIGNNNHKH